MPGIYPTTGGATGTQGAPVVEMTRGAGGGWSISEGGAPALRQRRPTPLGLRLSQVPLAGRPIRNLPHITFNNGQRAGMGLTNAINTAARGLRRWVPLLGLLDTAFNAFNWTHVRMNHNGYTKQASCGNFPEHLAVNGAYQCGIWPPMSTLPPVHQTPRPIKYETIDTKKPNASYGYTAWYSRNAGTNSGGPRAQSEPKPNPLKWPGLDPLSRKPRGPQMPTPKPIPYRLIPHLRKNPFRADLEQSARGNAPPDGSGSGAWHPGNPPIPATVHKPPPRTKEVKAKLRGFATFLRAGLGMVTEWIDAINAVYDALPLWARRNRGPLDPYEMGRVIYETILRMRQDSQTGASELEVFITRALLNLGIEMVEDMGYGLLGANVGSAIGALSSWSSMTGPTTGTDMRRELGDKVRDMYGNPVRSITWAGGTERIAYSPPYVRPAYPPTDPLYTEFRFIGGNIYTRYY